ncbi:MAG: amino acid ABC transporter substrate-binding protein [Proteobacteria bacterium]|nr:amino acid ABC transporter substrate-binding protein [Pseudomonadota bacterium]
MKSIFNRPEFKALVLGSIIVLLVGSFVGSLKAAEIFVYTTHEPPLNFTAGKNTSYAKGDQVVGVASDVVKEILKRTSSKAVVKLLPWARGYQAVSEKKNVFLFSMARTQARANQFQWIGPIATKKAILFAKKGSGITVDRLDDAKRVKSIGTMTDDSKEQYLVRNGFTNLEGSPTWEQSLTKLVMGRVDLWTQTDLDSPVIAKRAGVDINDIEAIYTLHKAVLYIGVNKKTSKALVRQWQKALDEIKSDGTFETIVEKWAAFYNAKNWIVRNGMLQVNYE